MNPADARALCQTVDWSTTMVIPIPRDTGSFQTVTVDGVEGTLIDSWCVAACPFGQVQKMRLHSRQPPGGRQLGKLSRIGVGGDQAGAEFSSTTIFLNTVNLGRAGADRISIRCISDESVPHYRRRRDGCMIAGVLEVKKEISVNGRLGCVDSLPARDRGICMVTQSSSICQEQSWAKIALFRLPRMPGRETTSSNAGLVVSRSELM